MTKELQKIYSNFTGGINLNVTKIGLFGSENRLNWDESFNVEILKNQGVCTQKGNTIVFESDDINSVFGICEVGDGSNDFIVISASGQIHYIDRHLGTSTLLSTLSSVPVKFSTSKFLDGMLIATGSNKLQYVKKADSVTIEPITIENAPDSEIFPDVVSVYASRVWVSKNSTVYFSALGTYDDWTTADDAGFIDSFHSSTSDILAMKEYAGNLAIYKTDGVYLLSGSTTDDFTVKKFGDLGTLSANSVLTENNKQYFACSKGIFALEQFGELCQIAFSGNLSQAINSEFDFLDSSKAHLARVLSLREKSQIWFFINSSKNLGISRVLIYDYKNKSWTIRLIPFEITCATEIDGKIYTGDANGKIYEENFGNTFSSKKIDFKFSTPFFHFNLPNDRKILGEVNLIFDQEWENSFKISVSRDYDSNKIYDIDTVDTATLNTLVFVESQAAQDKYNSVWADKATQRGFCWAEEHEEGHRIEVFDSATSFQLNFEGESLGDGFALIGIEFKDILLDV